MSEQSTSAVMRSEKVSQKKKLVIMWVITLLVFAATVVSFFVDYSSYSEGQKYGLTAMLAATGISDVDWIDTNDTYAEQCNSIYRHLTMKAPDINYQGIQIDMSDTRESIRQLNNSLEGIMRSGGYDIFSHHMYFVEDWFRYTNFAEYYVGHYGTQIIPICFYVILVFSTICTIVIKKEASKEIVIYEDYVLLKKNKKKSKQLVFEDIKNIDSGKSSLKIVGTGVKYKISNVLNADSITAYIIGKKKELQKNTMTTKDSVSSADELKKYKELLENGVITEEEFEAKKKKLLEL